MKSKISRSAWNIAKDRASQSSSLSKVNSYVEAFEKIKVATGIEDIDALVENFLNSEDENFTLFSYVNGLNQEIEALEDQIAEVKVETARFRAQSVNTESQRKKILEQLEERLAMTKQQTEEYESRYAAAVKTMTSLRHGILSLYNRIGCNPKSTGDAVDPSEGVTEQNMMTYLGIIEMRANSILQHYLASQPAALANAQAGAPESIQGPLALPGQGPAAPPGAGNVVIEPPSTNAGNDGSDDEDGLEEDGDDMPLSREKLREKALKSLARRDEEQAKRREMRSSGSLGRS